MDRFPQKEKLFTHKGLAIQEIVLTYIKTWFKFDIQIS